MNVSAKYRNKVYYHVDIHYHSPMFPGADVFTNFDFSAAYSYRMVLDFLSSCPYLIHKLGWRLDVKLQVLGADPDIPKGVPHFPTLDSLQSFLSRSVLFEYMLRSAKY